MTELSNDPSSVLAAAYGVPNSVGTITAAIVARTSEQLGIQPFSREPLVWRQIVDTTAQWTPVGQIVGLLLLNKRSLKRVLRGGRPEPHLRKMMSALVAASDPPVAPDTYVAIVLADIHAAVSAA